MFGSVEILKVFLKETGTEYNKEDLDNVEDQILFELYCSPQHEDEPSVYEEKTACKSSEDGILREDEAAGSIPATPTI